MDSKIQNLLKTRTREPIMDDRINASMSRFSSNIEKKVIVQRNSPIIFTNAPTMAIGSSFLSSSTSSDAEEIEMPFETEEVFEPQPVEEQTIPAGPAIKTSKALTQTTISSSALKSLQEKIGKPGFALQINKINSASLNAQNSVPQIKSQDRIIIKGTPKQIASKYIIKPIAPKPVVSNFTSTIIRPAFTNASTTTMSNIISPSAIRIIGAQDKIPFPSQIKQGGGQPVMLKTIMRPATVPPKRVKPVSIFKTTVVQKPAPVILNQVRPPPAIFYPSAVQLNKKSPSNTLITSTTETGDTVTYSIVEANDDDEDDNGVDEEILYEVGGSDAEEEHELMEIDDRINLEIKDGKISDPNGPIKMLTNIEQRETSDNFVSSTTNRQKFQQQRPRTPTNYIDAFKNHLKSPRLKRRANSDYQQQQQQLQNKQMPMQRRLSVPSMENENNENPESILPDIKCLTNKSDSLKTIDSSLLCNEKFEMESDESRSVKTSISTSSLNNISPPKGKEKFSKHPQDKLRTAIELYKLAQQKESTKSDQPKELDETDSDYFSLTPSDLIKWDDGIGYLRDSKLHFQFNTFGLIEPMEDYDYFRHVKTNVYDTLKEPLLSRNAMKNHRNKRKLLVTDLMYRCHGCQSRGTAGDFATPEFCSITCMKQTQKLRAANTRLLQTSHFESESDLSNTPFATSDEDSMNSLHFTKMLKYDKKKAAEIPASPLAGFDWQIYLEKVKGTAAPQSLFVNPFPSSKNKFQVGMKLEAIDPENNSLFCACSIVEVRGYRIKLTFDGFSREFDFWVNGDSMDIFPPGWCKKTGRNLLPPFGYVGEFDWLEYLTKSHSMAASRYLFTHLKSGQTDNPFKIGMNLEADDLKKTGKVGVASVIDKIDNRILIHFDGGDDRSDYWVDISSPYIHPTNWHKKNDCNLMVPPDWDEKEFTWPKYLKSKRSNHCTVTVADEKMFVTRKPFEFKQGMKLEVVDRKNPALIRPATILAIDGYEIKVCYDGWPAFYSFWIEDDSTDIHPMNWCKKTNHPIEYPPDFLPPSMKNACDIKYCLGFGNAKFSVNATHNQLAECPYEKNNWLNDERKRSRVVKRKRINVPMPIMEPIDPAIKSEPPDEEGDSSAQQTTQQVDSTTPAPEPVPNSSAESEPAKKSVKILESPKGESDFDKNPLKWSVEETANYIENCPGCSLIGKVVRDEEIDGLAFLSLTKEDLQRYLDIKMGPAIKVYSKIVFLREEVEKNFLEV